VLLFVFIIGFLRQGGGIAAALGLIIRLFETKRCTSFMNS